MVASAKRRRERGSIETLPSGSLRVKVYAGIDPLTKGRLYLDETIPAGPRAAKEAEKARTRLLAEVDERRNPRTRATVSQLLDEYLQVLDVEPTTRKSYVGYIRNHIEPALGTLSLSRLRARRSTRSTLSCVSAARAAAAERAWTIGQMASTTAPTAAGHMSAGHWRRRPSDRSTRS